MRSLLAAAALLLAGAIGAHAQPLTKMTIATGVDPAYSQFYVAKEGGLFEKNGLAVTINTGPSGSAMVPFLVNNQVQAAYGSDLAGVINHQVDKNIVAVADDKVVEDRLNQTAQTPARGTAKEFAASIVTQRAYIAKIVKTLGLQPTR